MSENRSTWIAVVNGKPDYFLMMQGSHKLKRRIKKYLHLNMKQFVAIGNFIRKATKAEIAAHESN